LDLAQIPVCRLNPMDVAPVGVATATPPLARRWSLAHLEGLGLAGITLIGFALRLPLLDRFPLHADEAIYSVWALHLWRDDPLLLHHWPDKPPLFLWLLGGVLQLLGPSQAGARWLNLAFSTITIPVVAALATRLGGRRMAHFAALALALNPFAISFASTAFTDPLLVLAGNLALLLALQRRPFWAGCWLAVAICTKQQGVLYAPLVLGLLGTQNVETQNAERWNAERRTLERRTTIPVEFRSAFCALRSALLGLALVLLPVIYWDSLRWAVAPSPWDLGVRNYGALALAALVDWPKRLGEWGALLWYLAASWPVWLLLVGGSVGLSLARRRSTIALRGQKFATQGHFWPSPRSLLQPTFLLISWSSFYLALHLFTTVQVWDRYLLPLAPPLALWIGWLVARGWSGRATLHQGLGLALVMALLLPPAGRAAQGHLPMGGDHGAYAGLPAALAWVRQQATEGGVIYHRTLGWHYQFYLAAELAAGHYELRWFPHAVYLADNAGKTPHRRKFWIEPVWSPLRDLPVQAAVRGLTLQNQAQMGQFTIYEIIQPPANPCPWCACTLPTPFPLLVPAGAGELSRP
jgi:hypothetical protein